MIESTDCVLILGQRKCGKSFLAKNLQKLWPRKVIIDTLNEYTEGDIVYSFNDFSDKLLQFKKQKVENFTLVFQFDPENTASDVEFNELMRLCYYFGNLLVIVEEVHLHSSPYQLPHWLQKNLLVGRHQNIALMITSQRPANVHKTIVSQCSHIFVGKIIEGNDLRYLAPMLNQNTEKLVSIPERRFLYFNNGKVIEISNDSAV